MACANGLTRAGFTPTCIHTTASVHLDAVDGGFAITRIDLNTEVAVPGIDKSTFQEQAETTKAN